MTEEDKKSKGKKKYQKSWSVWLMIILIVAGGIYIASDSQGGGGSESKEEIAKCIANKSTLYVQLGCHACKTQEEIFGDSYKYLDTVDCFYEQDKCVEKDITATPTWVINGERYTGYKQIDKLKELADC